MECKFFHTVEGNAGFAVMTYNFQFFVVGDSDRSRDELRVKKLADLPGMSLKIGNCRIITRNTHAQSMPCAEEYPEICK